MAAARTPKAWCDVAQSTPIWLTRCLLPLALAAAGCASRTTPPSSPEATVMAFSRALNQGKLDDAYALMSKEYRDRVSLEAFKEKLGGNSQEVLEISNALSRVRAPAQQEALLAYGDDQTLRLRRVGDSWLIATNVVDFYDQSTPRAALRSFVRAMERKRYDVVLRLIPSTDQEGITTDRMEQAWSGEQREEVERMVAALHDHLGDPIEVVGDHATMPYGDQRRVQMLREGNAWKIEDPE
ncbi:MAG: hypothetical protein ACHQ53_03255 [Polyangiales bacterium]